MKRITLLAVLALMVALALPVMATDFTWSGELTYGASTDFTKSADAYGNAFLGLTGKADANNTFYATLNTAYSGSALTVLTDLAGGTGTLNSFSAYFSAFYLTSDIGKILGLNGITAVATYGWIDTACTSYSVSGYGYESLIAYDPQGTRDNAQIVVGFGAPASIQVSVSPLVSNVGSLTFNPQILFDVYGGFGPINYSVSYSTNKTTNFMGTVGASVKWGQAMGDLTPAVNLEVTDNLTGNAMSLGVGASFAYTTMFSAGIGTAITLAPAFGMGNLGINTSFVPMANFGVDVDASMNLATGAANFINAIDASAWYMLGKSKARLGYLYSTGSGAYNAPVTLAPNGGIYFSWDLTF